MGFVWSVVWVEWDGWIDQSRASCKKISTPDGRTQPDELGDVVARLRRVHVQDVLQLADPDVEAGGSGESAHHAEREEADQGAEPEEGHEEEDDPMCRGMYSGVCVWTG